MYGYYAPVVQVSAEMKAFDRWMSEAKHEAARIIGVNQHLKDHGLAITIEPGLFGAVVTGRVGREMRRMKLEWCYLQNRESPIKDTVRNIANVLRLRSSGE